MLAWRLNAGLSHAWEGSESKHVEWKAARVDGHMHGRTVKARMSNREPRAWMDRERMHVESSKAKGRTEHDLSYRDWMHAARRHR